MLRAAHPTPMPHDDAKAFRDNLKDLRATAPQQWEASRHLVAAQQLPRTVERLRAAIDQAPLDEAMRQALHEGLSSSGPAPSPSSTGGEALKRLTGLPTAKALRALCVHFGLLDEARRRIAAACSPSDALLASLAAGAHPFTRLLESEAPSLIDLGAGDLSFIEALADQLLPSIRAHGRELTLDAIDRVEPLSAMGAAYQAPPTRLARLETLPGLRCRYWSRLDMFALAEAHRPRALLPRYDIASCWAPANPTFAYEPTRLTAATIRRDLEQTRGAFRQVVADGERVLEVRHRGRSLLFPSWKFDIRGPLALLDLLERTAPLAVLGAVDDAVFWELLAHLVADPQARTSTTIFTEQTRAALFGPLFDRLIALPVGAHLTLAGPADLCGTLPRVLGPSPSSPDPAAFTLRQVTIHRGATFPQAPSSMTAQRFAEMTEEPPPWCLTLVF